MPGLETCVFSLLCLWGAAENHQTSVAAGLSVGPVYVQHDYVQWFDWRQHRTGIYWDATDTVTLYMQHDQRRTMWGFNWRF